jgi:hypothetical protein
MEGAKIFGDREVTPQDPSQIGNKREQIWQQKMAMRQQADGQGLNQGHNDLQLPIQ